MPGLILPEWVAAQQINRAMEEQADAHMAEARHWSRELKRIDPGLDLVWISESADEAELTPARWHLRRRIPGTVDEHIALVGPNGEYRPPGAWMLDWLNANDMHNPRVHRDRREAKERLREARVRAKRLAAEQRVDVMATAARAARRLRSDAGMTQNFQAKRRGEGLRKTSK